MPERESNSNPSSVEEFQKSLNRDLDDLEKDCQEIIQDIQDQTAPAAEERSPLRKLIGSVKSSSSRFESKIQFEDIGTVNHVRDEMPTRTDLPHDHKDMVGEIQKSLNRDLDNLEKESQEIIQDIQDQTAPAAEVQSPLRMLIRSVKSSSSRFESKVQFEDIGTVNHVGDGVATLTGLPRVHTEDMLVFPTGVRGLVFSLEPRQLDVVLLGSDEGIRGGDVVRNTGKQLRIPVGPNLLGRVVNPLGEPLDGEPPADPSDLRLLEREAPGITARTPIQEPLHTGWKVIDALIPIGRGQRELILGDRQTGKTTIAVDAILRQKDSNMACVYVAIGQKKSSILEVIERLRKAGALQNTTVVLSTPDDPPALRYLAPYAGCTMAEYLMDHERDVLIIYDDLTKHANAYRELSLLLRRPPGREAYPGDVFYLHSRLLERAGKLHADRGAGSMTALPIIETQRGNLSAYIPTNLISITDGQIVLDAELFNRDIKPPVNVGLSVSRVGGEAQTEAMKKVAGELRLQLSQYEEVARFARLGTEVDEATQQQIERGTRLQEAFTQPPHQPMSLSEQVIFLFAIQQNALKGIAVGQVAGFEEQLLDHFRQHHEDLMEEIELKENLSEEMKERLAKALEDFLSAQAQRSNAG